MKNNIMTNRLKCVIKKDKENTPKYIADVIKSDFFYMINNFFEVDFKDVEIQINVNENNKYQILISATGDRAKVMKKIN